MPYRSSLCLMASMVRDREISPLELIDAHLRQIEEENPRINAFVTVRAVEARREARLAGAAVQRGHPLGLLHGVPVTVKDSFDVAGLPTFCGSRLRAGHRAARDAGAVARLRAEGAIVLGKTNCPEFLLSYETDNFVTGRTNHPLDPARTPGGSSGGEAAAIAAFCSPGGIGSDGGGSIRVPAHFCGIAGLKPTPGRISAAGHFPVIGNPGGLLGVAGPMARSAEDLRLLFAALAGYDGQDPFSAPVPLRVPEREDLRIGVVEQFGDVPVAPAVRRATLDAARALEAAGLHPEPFSPRGIERAPNLWWFFFGQLPGPFLKQLVERHETELHWTSVESLEKALAAPPPTAMDVLNKLAARDAMRAALLRQMEDVPVLLMPPCGVTAFPHRMRTWRVEESEIGLFQAMMPATPWNLLGFPALVVPFGAADDGMPAGVQLVGRPWEEERLLEIGIRLEQSRSQVNSK